MLLGGLVTGLIVLVGELALNLAVMGEQMAMLLKRFALPQPTPWVMTQAIARLLLLGMIAVWLASMLARALGDPHRGAFIAGLCIWTLSWAMVQWALVNTGFLTASIAVVNVAWGLVEAPLATWAGFWVSLRLNGRADGT